MKNLQHNRGYYLPRIQKQIQKKKSTGYTFSEDFAGACASGVHFSFSLVKVIFLLLLVLLMIPESLAPSVQWFKTGVTWLFLNFLKDSNSTESPDISLFNLFVSASISATLLSNCDIRLSFSLFSDCCCSMLETSTFIFSFAFSTSSCLVFNLLT